MKITITYDEALQLLARALSLKYDLRERQFRSTTKIASVGGSAQVQSIEFEFYDELKPETTSTRKGGVE